MAMAGFKLRFLLITLAIRIGIFLYVRRLAYHYFKSQHTGRSRRLGISRGYHAKKTRALERYGIRPTMEVRSIKSSPINPSYVDVKLRVA